MPNIVKFPHWIKNITETFDNVIKTIGTDDASLIHDLKIKRDEIIAIVNKHQAKQPKFTFTSQGDSVVDNAKTIEAAAKSMANEYSAICTDLLAEIAILKINECMLKRKSDNI